jgi:hypothetical protein
MVNSLERDGRIRRQPGVVRSIDTLVPPQDSLVENWQG